MTTTTATQANVTSNVHLAMDMLEHAEPHIVLDRMAKQVPMPKNKRETIYFRRPVTFSAATTPLAEGVTPNATQFDYDSESATLAQYAQHVIVTDLAEDTAENPVVKDAAMICGENIGRTREALLFGTVRAGTSVAYTNGSARSAVNSVLTLGDVRGVVRTLRANKAKPITRVMAPGPNFNTTPIAPAYVAVCHTDVEADIRNLSGFTPAEEYSSQNLIHPNEMGKVEGVRFVCSADLGPWEDVGGSPSTNGVVSTSGSSADVYPILFFGQEAFASVTLKGYGSIEPTIIPASQKTKDDPHGQRGYIGWKIYFASTILNDNWVVRLESSVTDL